jgi:hypothetical protein
VCQGRDGKEDAINRTRKEQMNVCRSPPDVAMAAIAT